MDNSNYRQTFNLNNKNEIFGKNFIKIVKFQNFVKNIVMFRRCSLIKFANFLIVLREKNIKPH